MDEFLESSIFIWSVDSGFFNELVFRVLSGYFKWYLDVVFITFFVKIYKVV